MNTHPNIRKQSIFIEILSKTLTSFHYPPQKCFRGWEATSTKGGFVSGVAALGVQVGLSPPDAGELFKKFITKSMNNLQFISKIFKKISKFVQNLFKFYRIFGENLEICVCRGFGCLAPRRLQIDGKITFMEFWNSEYLKSMETCNFCILLNEFLPFSQLFK